MAKGEKQSDSLMAQYYMDIMIIRQIINNINVICFDRLFSDYYLLVTK